jgi:hypothetical protein
VQELYSRPENGFRQKEVYAMPAGREPAGFRFQFLEQSLAISHA